MAEPESPASVEPLARTAADTRAHRVAPTPPVLAVGSSLTRADVPLLCLRLRLLSWSRGDRRVLCDLGRLATWDVGTVDALARLALDARRIDCRIVLVAAPPDLPGMLELVGLADVLPCSGRQPS